MQAPPTDPLYDASHPDESIRRNGLNVFAGFFKIKAGRFVGDTVRYKKRALTRQVYTVMHSWQFKKKREKKKRKTKKVV